MKNKTIKKVLKITGDVIFGIVLVFILFFAISNIRAKSSNDLPNIFGYGYLNVLSDSMDGNKEDSFKIGDLLFVKMINKEETKNLKEGDVITYSAVIENKEMTISHRIVEIKTIQKNDGGSYKLFLTQGDNPLSEYADRDAVRDDEVLAVVQGKWAGAGTVFAWFSTGFGFFLIVCVPCILFLIFEIINFVKVYIEYKNEKQQVAMVGGPDSIQNKIRMRKAAYDDLVKEGTLTKEQAEAALNEYIKSVSVIENETTIEETPLSVSEPVEVSTEEVKEDTPLVEEINDETLVVEDKVEELPVEETITETKQLAEENKPIVEEKKKNISTKKSTTKKTTTTGTAKKKTSSTGAKKTTTKKSAE